MRFYPPPLIPHSFLRQPLTLRGAEEHLPRRPQFRGHFDLTWTIWYTDVSNLSFGVKQSNQMHLYYLLVSSSIQHIAAYLPCIYIYIYIYISGLDLLTHINKQKTTILWRWWSPRSKDWICWYRRNTTIWCSREGIILQYIAIIFAINTYHIWHIRASWIATNNVQFLQHHLGHSGQPYVTSIGGLTPLSCSLVDW